MSRTLKSREAQGLTPTTNSLGTTLSPEVQEAAAVRKGGAAALRFLSGVPVAKALLPRTCAELRPASAQAPGFLSRRRRRRCRRCRAVPGSAPPNRLADLALAPAPQCPRGAWQAAASLS